jgi:hypothetical protein
MSMYAAAPGLFSPPLPATAPRCAGTGSAPFDPEEYFGGRHGDVNSSTVTVRHSLDAVEGSHHTAGKRGAEHQFCARLRSITRTAMCFLSLACTTATGTAPDASAELVRAKSWSSASDRFGGPSAESSDSEFADHTHAPSYTRRRDERRQRMQATDRGREGTGDGDGFSGK